MELVKDEEELGHEQMRDEEIEQFIRCSGCYYRICSGSHDMSWRQLAQQSIDRVVNAYYNRPKEARTQAFVMDHVEQIWTDDVDKFNSVHHYRQVKRISTKYLMQYLESGFEDNALVMRSEPLSVYVKELDLELSMMFHLIEWTESSFLIRKFFVTDEPEVIKAFIHMSIVFSHLAFGRLPDRIEVFSLLSGKSYDVIPDPNHVQQSLDYLRLLIGTMREGAEARTLNH